MGREKIRRISNLRTSSNLNANFVTSLVQYNVNCVANQLSIPEQTEEENLLHFKLACFQCVNILCRLSYGNWQIPESGMYLIL